MARKPSLLLVATTLPAIYGDGTPRFVLDLAMALAEEYDVHVLAPRVPLADTTENIGAVRIRRFSYFPRRWEGLAAGAIAENLRREPWRLVEAISLVLRMAIELVRTARSVRPIAVNAHWIIPAGLCAAITRGIHRTPILLTIHGGDAFLLKGRLWSLVKAFVVRKSTVCLPVSHDIAAELNLSNFSTVPMGVNVELVRSIVGKRSPCTGVFLFVGRLVEKKGLPVLLRALSQVPNAQLNVLGDGPERVRSEQLAGSLGIADRVNFFGDSPSSVVAENLRHCTALVVPSVVAPSGDKDGMPVVVAEAVAAGVPVIASAIGGIPEYLDNESAFLVKPGSVPSLRKALSKAKGDDGRLLQGMASAATDRALPRLDVRRTARTYGESIQDIGRR